MTHPPWLDHISIYQGLLCHSSTSKFAVRPKIGMLPSLFHGLWAVLFHYSSFHSFFSSSSYHIISFHLYFLFPYFSLSHMTIITILNFTLLSFSPLINNTVATAKSFSRCVQWCLPRAITTLGFHPHQASSWPSSPEVWPYHFQYGALPQVYSHGQEKSSTENNSHKKIVEM